MNGVYIRKKDIGELLELCRPYFKKFEKKLNDGYLKKIVIVERERMKKLADVAENVDFYFTQPKYAKRMLFWKKMDEKELLSSLQKSLGVIGKIRETDWDIEKIKDRLVKMTDPKNRGNCCGRFE